MNEQIGRSAIPKRRLEVRVRAQRNRTFIALAADVRELDQVATFIWRQMDGTRSVGDIAAALSAEYGVDEGTAVADTAEFARDLADAGFVELAGAPR
jgi:coenzyme PQQ synthesis protein D (PqqD)